MARGGEGFSCKAMERDKLCVAQSRHLAMQQRLDPHIERRIEDAAAEAADKIEHHSRDRIVGVTLPLQLLDVRREGADRQFPRRSRGGEPSIATTFPRERLEPDVRELVGLDVLRIGGGTRSLTCTM